MIALVLFFSFLIGCSIITSSNTAPSLSGSENKKELSFTCKDAIARGDKGAIDVFCHDMDFMLRESIKQNNPGGVDTFGNDVDFMCRQAIKNKDKGGIGVFCK